MVEPARVRRLVPADLPAYKALRDELLAAHPEAFTSDAGEEVGKPPDAYLGRLGGAGGDTGTFTLGAFVEGRLAGALSCEREARAKASHLGLLIGMMVRPALQGRGLGRALLDAALAEARAVPGLERLTLSVTAGNVAAMRLYERAGFVVYGRLEGAVKVDARYHAKLLMTLPL